MSDPTRESLADMLQKVKGKEALDLIIQQLDGKKQEITEFPEDLESTDMGYMTKKDFRGSKEVKAWRIDFPNGITILMLKPGDNQNDFCSGIYKDGKYDGGNHDFSAWELFKNITE